MRRHEAVRAAREVLLTCGALLGVICLAATLAGTFAGVKPLVFRSGSMSPAIQTGDLGIARTVDADDLRRGDVVSVVNANGSRVTHRLVDVAGRGEVRRLTLQGDANRTPDAEVHAVDSAERVLFHVPHAGRVVDAATSPAGVFVLGLYVAGMLVLVFRREPPGPTGGAGASGGPRRGGARKAETPRRTTARLSSVVAAAMLAMVASPAAAAHWTDAAVADGVAFGAHAVLPPESLTCSGGGLLASLTYTFPNRDLRYEYVVTLEDSAGVVRRTDVVTNNGSVGTSQSITYGFTLLNGIVGLPATVTVRVRSRLASTTAWESQATVSQTGRLLSLGILGLGSSC